MANHKEAKTIQAVILAAGTSSRFKTGRTKLVEKICGRPMILYPTGIMQQLGLKTIMVVGFQKESIQEVVVKDFSDSVTFVHQEEQKGTGHAIACTKDTWTADHILVLNGDMPLITQDIIEKIIKKHIESDATVSFATAHHCDPEALYGRVIQADNTIKIVEAKDFEGDLAEQCCVNAGIYLIKKDFLLNHIDQLDNNNASKEWYITDLINIASKQQLKIVTLSVPFDRIRGVNDFKELWAAEQIKKSEIIQHWMAQGVRFCIAHNVQIDWDVTIGSGSFIGSGAQLLEGTKVGKNSTIGAFSFLKNTVIGDRTHIYPHSYCDSSTVGNDASVGPFSYIHGNSTLKDNAVVGSFVEVNRSTIGSFSKAKHLAYLGDTMVGQQVTVGAGFVACNYDGAKKHQTIIQDNAFIGGNNTFVAPVTIGASAITAAGSTITQDVPANALAIARERQVNKENYAEKIREKINGDKAETEVSTGTTWAPLEAGIIFKQAE